MSSDEKTRSVAKATCLTDCSLFMEYEDTLLQQVAVMGMCLKKIFKLVKYHENQTPDYSNVLKYAMIGAATTLKMDDTIKKMREKKNPGA